MTLDVSRETRKALQQFADLLLSWNKTLNLIARNDESALWTRHIEDSLQLAPLIPLGVRRAIDLGSGAGFPGLVLAMATGVAFDLVEADNRKAAFLREAIRVTGAPATVQATRAESTHLDSSSLVTARALAPLPRLLSLAERFLAPAGTALFLKGATVDSELTAAAVEWHMQVERVPSRTAPGACILRITDISRVPSHHRS